MDAKEYEVTRDKRPPLVFVGWLRGEVSSRAAKARWTELRVYETQKRGRFIAEQVGVTMIPGERTRRQAIVCETEDEVERFFGEGPLARELYLVAGFDGIEEVS